MVFVSCFEEWFVLFFFIIISVCPTPPMPPTNATSDVSESFIYLDGDVVNYFCRNSLYAIIDTAFVVCQEDGTWSSDAISDCEQVCKLL